MRAFQLSPFIKRLRSMRRIRAAVNAFLAFSCFPPVALLASENVQDSKQIVPQSVMTQAVDSDPDRFGLHLQFTGVAQWHPQFASPYSGRNSLSAGNRNEETTDVTLFAGMRVWQGGEVWVNPEIDQGFGLNNTLGVAGFPSGEGYKVGAAHPYWRLPRLFLRQVFDLGGEVRSVPSQANQLGGTRTADNLTLTVGKFSVVDFFDTNTYAHDPRSDFLNWSLVDAGAFDYAADAWGYTLGGAVEWTQSWWTLRGGIFALSKIPNGKNADTTFRQRAWIGEWETRHQWWEHPGKLKFLAFVNHGRMAAYDDAVNLAGATGTAPDATLVRHDSSRTGYALNMEQELTAGLGVFARASVNDGNKEAFEFTEINRSLSGGVSIHGDYWGRQDDVVGIAAVVNGLSAAARRYFAAGGLGILIGDGRLPHYGQEQIAEAYYRLPLSGAVALSADYQYVVNPAYNRDRGPVSIFGLRIHAEF
jgi:high affinity Mn2+ porin